MGLAMELQDFIDETLKQIINGVRSAQGSAIELGVLLPLFQLNNKSETGDMVISSFG